MQSDYCYFLLDRLIWLDRRVEVRIRPVLPGLIRNPDAYRGRGDVEADYFHRDTARLSEMLAMPYRYPDPSPVEFVAGSLWLAAEEQPRVKGLYQLFVAATLAGRGLAWLDQVMRLIWDGRGVDWTTGAHLDDATRAAGLDPEELRAIAPMQIEAALQANHDAMAQAGHWGVPLMVVEGEPFYGQDRFDHVLWRLGLWQPAEGGIPR